MISHSNRNPFILAALAVVIAYGLTQGSSGQQQGDEQRRFLEVRRRQLELQAARKQAERTEKLAAQGLVPQTEVDRERNNVGTAQLNYQQSVLTLLDLQPRISVRSAVKTQSADGRKFVDLVIANLTPTFDDSQFKLLNNFEGSDPIPEQLRTRTVNDIFISLRDAGGPGGPGVGLARGMSTTISVPYEVHIAQMKYGETRAFKYQLLRDVDSVIVALAYRNQTTEIPVQLQHSANGSEIQISSSQISQEADLGNQATYNLTFERPSVDVRSFQLKVVNLPLQITYSFIDPQSQARLSQINFPAGVTQQTLGLRLFLPERASSQIPVDQPLEFWALALDEAAAGRFEQGRSYTSEELSVAGSGRIRVVIIPRGVGKIETSAVSLFSEVESGHTVETKITVRNTGTRRLDNVRLSAECPPNWRVSVEPDLIAALAIGREDEVALKFLTPPDAGVGDYEIRIRTESFADNRRVQSEDKIYRISVKASTNLLRVTALVGAVLLLAGGGVFIGVKMTRR